MREHHGKPSRCKASPAMVFAITVAGLWIVGSLFFFRGRGNSSTAVSNVSPFSKDNGQVYDRREFDKMPRIVSSAKNGDMEEAARALLDRVLGPAVALSFTVSVVDRKAGEADYFEVNAVPGSEMVLLRGTNGVAVASALNWYLRYVAKVDTSWNSDFPLLVPLPIAPVHTAIKKQSLVEWSYYENVCTFSYTQVWWDWSRWEREIDWMAMSGINLPLALTGYEYVAQETFARFGLTKEDMSKYFTGPGFLAWNRMVNIKGWGGPLPQSWIEDQKKLQIQILRRERELGMTPVLPAFSGGVPDAMQDKFPTAEFHRHGNWGGFEKEYCCLLTVSPQNPLFTKIGKAFVEEVEKAYGTDHVYSCDTFNENRPGAGTGKTDLDYLASSSKAVYESMLAADKEAVWVMQGWLFMNDAKFWQEPQLMAYLSAVPKDRMIILDLFTDVYPVWKRQDLERPTPIEGRPWIWNMLHSFGGNSGMYGRMQVIAKDPIDAKLESSDMVGIGITTEGIEQNPAVYEMMAEMRWRNTEVDIEEWMNDWSDRRLGPLATEFQEAKVLARKAWSLVAGSAYSCPTTQMGQVKSMIECRPRLDLFSGYIPNSDFMPIRRHYKESTLVSAWHHLSTAMSEIKMNSEKSSASLYDMSDLTRQVLSDLFSRLFIHLIGFAQTKAHLQTRSPSPLPRLPSGSLKSIEDAEERVRILLDIIDDMDQLMGTQEQNRLGHWIMAARELGANDPQAEKTSDLYEFNARNLVTMWGPRGEINDYSSRQWNGLLKGYYKPRWNIFFNSLLKAMRDGGTFEEILVTAEVQRFETSWQTAQDQKYLPSAEGDVMMIVEDIKKKYLTLIEHTAEEDIYAEELPLKQTDKAKEAVTNIESGHA